MDRKIITHSTKTEIYRREANKSQMQEMRKEMAKKKLLIDKAIERHSKKTEQQSEQNDEDINKLFALLKELTPLELVSTYIAAQFGPLLEHVNTLPEYLLESINELDKNLNNFYAEEIFIPLFKESKETE